MYMRNRISWTGFKHAERIVSEPNGEEAEAIPASSFFDVFRGTLSHNHLQIIMLVKNAGKHRKKEKKMSVAIKKLMDCYTEDEMPETRARKKIEVAYIAESDGTNIVVEKRMPTKKVQVVLSITNNKYILRETTIKKDGSDGTITAEELTDKTFIGFFRMCPKDRPLPVSDCRWTNKIALAGNKLSKLWENLNTDWFREIALLGYESIAPTEYGPMSEMEYLRVIYEGHRELFRILSEKYPCMMKEDKRRSLESLCEIETLFGLDNALIWAKNLQFSIGDLILVQSYWDCIDASRRNRMISRLGKHDAESLSRYMLFDIQREGPKSIPIYGGSLDDISFENYGEFIKRQKEFYGKIVDAYPRFFRNAFGLLDYKICAAQTIVNDTFKSLSDARPVTKNISGYTIQSVHSKKKLADAMVNMALNVHLLDCVDCSKSCLVLITKDKVEDTIATVGNDGTIQFSISQYGITELDKEKEGWIKLVAEEFFKKAQKKQNPPESTPEVSEK